MASKGSKGLETEKDSLISNKLPQYDAEDDDESSASDKDEKGSVLVTAFLLMLVFSLGNRIFGRLQTFPMHNYPLFTNMLSVFIYIPVSFAYIIPVQMYTNIITKEQTDIPKYKFGVMGIYDSIAGIMQTFATNYISNSSTIVLVQQSAIPISMIISKYALSAQYTTAQYIGAAVVLAGIVLVLIPTFLQSSSSDSSTVASSSSGSGPNELLWIGVMVISCVPMCLSSVYKEKALGETEIDVVYINGWVAVFQFLIALPLCLPSAEVINIPFDQIMPNMRDGAKCWLGYNTVTDATDVLWKDECGMAPLYVNLYLAFNVIYNILIIVILKHGSANILWMASTVIVPLSNIAFSLDFMPGHKPLTVWDIAGLVVIMIGLLLYRFMSPIIALYENLTGSGSGQAEETEEEKRAIKVGKATEKSQVKFLGFNQAEALNTLIDTRVWKAQRKSLFRTPQQIRGNLLVRLGIPPSPHISLTSAPSRSPVVGNSIGNSNTPRSMVRTLSLKKETALKTARTNSPEILPRPINSSKPNSTGIAGIQKTKKGSSEV